MTHKICDACETVAHCSNHGCIPIQPAQQKPLTPEWIWMWLRKWCDSHPSLRQETYNSLYKMVSDARALEAAYNIGN